jgi:hypothetical protein
LLEWTSKYWQRKHLNTDCLKSLITDRFSTIESKFFNIWSINNVSNFIILRNNHLSIKIENSEWRYLWLKWCDDINDNFGYSSDFYNQFEHNEFYRQLFCYLKNEIEPTYFNLRIIPVIDIKLEMMDSCKES